MDPSRPVSSGVISSRLLLPVILALALWVRLWGVWFGLPYLYHADEPIVVNHALAYGTGDLNPHFFNIPPLISYLLFLCYGLYYLVGHSIGSFHSLADFENLFYFNPASFYLIARLAFGVFLGSGSVYFLYRLVKKCWDKEVALWAAFFFALNFLHARDSHYIYTDIPLVFVILVGFFIFFRIHDRPGLWRNHCLAGAVIGLATATKYNGIFLAIPYLWICLCTEDRKKWPVFCGMAGICAAAVFILLNPYSVLDGSFFLNEIMEQSRANSGGVPWFHHFNYSLVGAFGVPLLGLTLAGLSCAVFSKNVHNQALSAFIIGYYLVLCKWGQPYDRYVLPLVPALCILAANLVRELRIKMPRLAVAISLLAVVFAAPPFLKIIQWDRIMSTKDVRTVAKEWVEANIPAGSRIAMDWEFFMPRLAFSPNQLEEKKKMLTQGGAHDKAKMRRLDALLAKSYQPSFELYFLSKNLNNQRFLFGEPQIPFDMKELRRKGVEYVLLTGPLHPANSPFPAELQSTATLVMAFSPHSGETTFKIHDALPLTGGPFLWKDIFTRTRNGYPIQIYKLK